MNIKITYNWLLEYLDTDATPEEIQKYLSLSGPSIEKVEKVDDDYVFDIEITSNRVDAASVFGIAQEAQAILPRFGKRAKIKLNPLTAYRFTNIATNVDIAPPLEIKTNPDLNPRFTTIILDVKIDKSPLFVTQRLNLCGVKSINNVIDISNYLMLALGQPVHVFDYDKIEGDQMILQESKKGEKITTLDEKTIDLPGGDIIIKDGAGRLIDLCGIMGGLNSAVSEKTQRIILFVQTYNKKTIRKTSMTTGQRTIAATYFEKGLDPERVEPTLVYGVELLKKYASGAIVGPLEDIYFTRYQPKKINITQEDINRRIGVEVKDEKVLSILTSLGFKVEKEKERYTVTIPSFRNNDMEIKEDIVEEIARIFGYFNLPNQLPPCVYVSPPKNMENLFNYESQTKHFLKNIGINEVMNYSMVSQELLSKLSIKVTGHLSIANAISEEIKYLRTSLLPSLVKNIKDNQGKKDFFKFFEIAKVYLPQVGELPAEIYKLGITTNTDFFDLKGVIDILFDELNIRNYQVSASHHQLLAENKQADIMIGNTTIGCFGQLKPEYQLSFNIKREVFLAELDFQSLANHAKLIPVYKPINPYAVIKLDLTLKIGEYLNYAKIKKTAFESSKLLDKIEVVNLYDNNLSLRFYFSSTTRNITEEEAKQELKKIQKNLL